MSLFSDKNEKHKIIGNSGLFWFNIFQSILGNLWYSELVI